MGKFFLFVSLFLVVLVALPCSGQLDVTTTKIPDSLRVLAESDEPTSDVCTAQIIPGIERMARGIDITELDLTPSNLHSSNGYRGSVIDFTCKEGRKWTNPTAGDVEYLRPDQISGVNTLPAGQLKAKIEISGDSEEFKTTWGVKVGISVDTVRFGAYSASTDLKKVQENMYRSNRSTAETSATVSAIQVDFKSAHSLKLTDDFATFLPTNPIQNYEDQPELYHDFLANFGTHYYQSAIFGGYLYLRTEINENYMMNSDEMDIKVDLEASFMEKVKVKSETEHGTKKVSDSFRRNSQTEFSYYGGTPVPISEDDPIGWMEQWVPTVNKDPWLFAGQLRPIEGLIPNYTLRNEVKKAVTIKMGLAYLDELKNEISLSRFQVSRADQDMMTKFEKQLKSRNKKDIEEMLPNLEVIFKQVQSLRDRNLLTKLKNNWNSKIDDIIDCKTYLISACARNLVETNRKACAPALAFPPKIDKELAVRGLMNHKEVKELLKEAGKMITQHEKPVNMCPPGQSNWECKKCIKIGADYGVKSPRKPFCRTPEAWKVIDYTPIFPGR